MQKQICVFDIETQLDTLGVCHALKLGPHDEQIARDHIGEEFPKLPFHKLICIGRVEAFFDDNAWRVAHIACDHAGDMGEAEMLSHFDARVAQLKPTLIGYNIKGFDMPVMRYRSMMNHVTMKGLSARKYFARYFDEAEDLCDILANYDARGKVTLDLLTRLLGLPGKPDDVDGSKLTPLIKAGEFEKIARYCEQDVVLEYLVWLRYQLYLGNLSPHGYQEGVRRLDRYIQFQKPHLKHLCAPPASPPSVQDLFNAGQSKTTSDRPS